MEASAVVVGYIIMGIFEIIGIITTFEKT